MRLCESSAMCKLLRSRPMADALALVANARYTVHLRDVAADWEHTHLKLSATVQPMSRAE